MEGWGEPPRGTRGCVRCGKPTEVYMRVSAHKNAAGEGKRGGGSGKTLRSRSLSFCNTHALETYPQLEALLEGRS